MNPFNDPQLLADIDRFLYEEAEAEKNRPRYYCKGCEQEADDLDELERGYCADCIKDSIRRAIVTFEEIARANAGIRTLNIKGKNYAPVTERIKAFRTVCPNGSIETEMLEDADGRCVFKATVRDGETVLGVGHAFEKEESSFINKTSYVENCETSAVGRALGMAGFGTDESLASYEELANALKNQEKEKPKTSGPICSECGREILPATNANGKMWTAEKIAQTTTKKYGRALCCGCARALHPSER